jgi:hypothetical protein
LKSYSNRKNCEQKITKVKVNDRKDFSYELSLIQNDYLREFAEFCLDNAPDYFYTYPASKSGEYHPRCSNELYGLTRHTKYCVRLANELMKDGFLFPFNDSDKDLIYVTLLLHDLCKYGFGKYKNFLKHGGIAVHYVEDIVKGTEFESIIKSSAWDTIKMAIRRHLGLYSKSAYGLPQTELELFVARVDYITSLQVQDEIEDLKNEEIEKK